MRDWYVNVRNTYDRAIFGMLDDAMHACVMKFCLKYNTNDIWYADHSLHALMFGRFDLLRPAVVSSDECLL